MLQTVSSSDGVTTTRARALFSHPNNEKLHLPLFHRAFPCSPKPTFASEWSIERTHQAKLYARESYSRLKDIKDIRGDKRLILGNCVEWEKGCNARKDGKGFSIRWSFQR